MTKFHTKFRPGDLVKDKVTGDEGVIIAAEAEWDGTNSPLHLGTFRSGCTERKYPKTTYMSGHYGIFSKTLYGSLNGWWFHDDQIELATKGHLW